MCQLNIKQRLGTPWRPPRQSTSCTYYPFSACHHCGITGINKLATLGKIPPLTCAGCVGCGWLTCFKQRHPESQQGMPLDFQRSPCSVVQRRPFELLVFPFWSTFSRGLKRLTFYFQVLWASELLQYLILWQVGPTPPDAMFYEGVPLSWNGEKFFTSISGKFNLAATKQPQPERVPLITLKLLPNGCDFVEGTLLGFVEWEIKWTYSKKNAHELRAQPPLLAFWSKLVLPGFILQTQSLDLQTRAEVNFRRPQKGEI